jgi:hypothetical protein
VDLGLFVCCVDDGTAAVLKVRLLETIKKRSAAEGLEIPYTCANVFLKSPSASVSAPTPGGGTS